MTSETILIIFNLITVAVAVWLYALQSKQFNKDKNEIVITYENQLKEWREIYTARFQELQTEKQQLIDRLFVKHGLAPSGVDLNVERAKKLDAEIARKQASSTMPTSFPKGRGLVAKAQMEALAADEAAYQSQPKFNTV